MIRNRMNYRIYFGLYLLLLSHFSYSQIIETYTIRSNVVCAGDNSLVVITAAQLPALSGHSIKQVSLLNYSRERFYKIVFQIDQKDAQGRYILDDMRNKEIDKKNNDKNRQADRDSAGIINTFTDKDELVFRSKDLNERVDYSSKFLKYYSLIELEIISGTELEKTSKWLYIKLDSEASEPDLEHNKALNYDDKQDEVTSSVYKIGFSKAYPFLLDRFHWRLPDQAGWTPDITDMMKIRHTGRFFGLPFKRTQEDYYSQLIAVKEGPLRIIRRTENNIRVFLRLKSPALFIDYIMLPNGFVMDSLIDIPFKVSFFFSELATITTMDWNNSADNLDLSIQADKEYTTIPINGLASDKKKAFNQIAGNTFSLTSNRGDFNVALDIPDDFPIQSDLYLRDALDELDAPENYPGQFGNIGFKTTGWENVGSQLYHLNFIVCVNPAK